MHIIAYKTLVTLYYTDGASKSCCVLIIIVSLIIVKVYLAGFADTLRQSRFSYRYTYKKKIRHLTCTSHVHHQFLLRVNLGQTFLIDLKRVVYDTYTHSD